MSRSKITSASIEDSTIAAKDIASGAVEDAMVTPSGRRNLIINGAMQVAQRGTSFTQANPGTSSFYYLDRFKMQSDLPPITYVVDKSSDVPAGSGFSNCFKVTVTSPASSFPDASGRYFRIRQSLEAQDVRHLVNKTVTLSFWVKSSVVGQFDVTFFAQDSSSNHYIVPYNIDSANTWEKKEITFTGPATINDDTGMGLDIQWQLARAGTNYQTTSTEVWGPTRLSSTTSTADVATTANATFQLTGVQLEVGSVATPFEHRSYGEELALCQRYYQRYESSLDFVNIWSGDITNGNTYYLSGLLVVEMRTVGTFTMLSTGYGGMNSPLFQAISKNTFRAYSSSTTTQPRGFFQFNFEVDAEL